MIILKNSLKSCINVRNESQFSVYLMFSDVCPVEQRYSKYSCCQVLVLHFDVCAWSPWRHSENYRLHSRSLRLIPLIVSDQLIVVCLPSGAGASGGGAGGDDQTAPEPVHHAAAWDRHVQPECEYSFSSAFVQVPFQSHCHLFKLKWDATGEQAKN